MSDRSAPNFEHLVRITDHFGTFEHCEHALPRREHGYCVDDVARVLVVAAREPRLSTDTRNLAEISLDFIEASHDGKGTSRNRRASNGRWTSSPALDDSWGRSIWGLGVAVASGHDSLAERAVPLFETAAQHRSAWSRSMAFAALGAAEVVRVDPDNYVAISLLRDAALMVGVAQSGSRWPWPEPRLAYANALLPDALMAIGTSIGRPELVDDGLTLLAWLLARETREGHLSVTPAYGSGPGDVSIGFDQQPIELSTMADACARAMTIDGSARWRNAIAMADAWFDGDNDARLVMWDPVSGGAFDGLHANAVNKNQGAESDARIHFDTPTGAPFSVAGRMTKRRLAKRRDVHILPNDARVITQLFVAGNELGANESRAASVVARVGRLSEPDVEERLNEVLVRFAHRHRDIEAVFDQHAKRVGPRIDPEAKFSHARWLLLGAAFTHEFSVEAASVCNPSMVAHPDQSGVAEGSVRFVMSFRAIGEGHVSSIGFRTGIVSETGVVVFDERKPFPDAGVVIDGVFHRDLFHAHLRAIDKDGESAAYVLDHLPKLFTREEFDARVEILVSEIDTRPDAHVIARNLRTIAALSYAVHFDASHDLSERVLWPVTSNESNGMEDARFVRFVDDDGTVTYLATYTAYDGREIAQQIIQTQDFVDFTISPVAGTAAAYKGLALFPRRVDGRFAALSRYDRESNSLTYSDTLWHWGKAVTFQLPERDWEILQIGNCGSPIETDRGWLVLTHGVGPMRSYSISAVLLDLDQPTKMIAALEDPLIVSRPDEQDGYVPNVVYTCGAMLHGDVLVIPYGVADARINLATRVAHRSA